MSYHSRRLATIAGALALCAIAATTGETLTATTHTERDTLSASGTCGAVAGANTNLNEITFAIHAEGRADDTRWIPASHIKVSNPGSPDVVPPPGPQDVVGVATAVTCEIIDRETGEVHGAISAGQPGPNAVAAGTVKIPRLAEVDARVCVTAVFADGERLKTCG